MNAKSGIKSLLISPAFIVGSLLANSTAAMLVFVFEMRPGSTGVLRPFLFDYWTPIVLIFVASILAPVVATALARSHFFLVGLIPTCWYLFWMIVWTGCVTVIYHGLSLNDLRNIRFIVESIVATGVVFSGATTVIMVAARAINSRLSKLKSQGQQPSQDGEIWPPPPDEMK